MNRKRKAVIAGNEVSRIAVYKLGGYGQTVSLDGRKKDNPIVIFLHGGPGSPMPFSVGSRGMFPELTDRATLVCWDQLGCGINNRPIDDSFTVEQFIGMTIDLIHAIRQEFPGVPVNLFGVSWGSVLAAEAANRVPELLAHVAVYGQVVKNLTFNEEVYGALERSAMSAGKKKRLARMRGEKEHSIEDMKTLMGWIRKYTEGYQAKTGGKMPIGSLLLGLLQSPDYSIKDVAAMMINGYTKNDSLMGELMHIDLTDTIGNVKIPYLIMQGGTDIVTSTKTASELVASCTNKNLRLRVMENSGHLPGGDAMSRIIEEVAAFLGC